MNISVRNIDGEKLKSLKIDGIDTLLNKKEQADYALQLLDATIDLLKGNISTEHYYVLLDTLNNITKKGGAK